MSATCSLGGCKRVLKVPVRVRLFGCRSPHLRAVPDSPTAHARSVVCHNKLGDELLDFVTAGPKLRKWYGKGQNLPRDGGDIGDDNEEEPAQQSEGPIVRDVIFVTDPESSTGEQVLLQLILARARIRACFQDTTVAKTSYGPYVEAASFDIGSQRACESILKDVQAIICLGRLGALPAAAKSAGVEHVVLLSTAGGQGGGFNLFGGGDDAGLREPKREQDVASCGVPHTIVKASSIRDVPGGRTELRLLEGASGGGVVSREDMARVVVQALGSRPAAGITFQVAATEKPADSQPQDLAGAIAALHQAPSTAR